MLRTSITKNKIFQKLNFSMSKTSISNFSKISDDHSQGKATAPSVKQCRNQADIIIYTVQSQLYVFVVYTLGALEIEHKLH